MAQVLASVLLVVLPSRLLLAILIEFSASTAFSILVITSERSLCGLSEYFFSIGCFYRLVEFGWRYLLVVQQEFEAIEGWPVVVIRDMTTWAS